jgi:hypothetical protein
VAIIYYGFFKRKNLPLFLAYWYLGSLTLFSWAGERMPQLVMHTLLPSLLLAAFFIGEILDSQPLKQWGRCARVGALLIFSLLLSYSIHASVLLTFYHGSNPVESLVYVPCSSDCEEVEGIIRKISYGETGGPDMGLTLEDKTSWPFAWLLRDFSKRNHPMEVTGADNPIILTSIESDPKDYLLLKQANYVNRKYGYDGESGQLGRRESGHL